jgi:excinuclease ABC subunit C
MYHIERCAGPCAGHIERDQYAGLVDELAMFLDGDTAPILERLEVQMREAAGRLEFELAARLRDRAASVRKAIEKQQMVSERPEDLDCFALAEDELEAAVQVFYVRRGRVVGRKGFIVDKVEDLEPPQLLAHILEQHYSDAINGVPPVVLVPGEVDEKDVLEEWLWALRAQAEAEARHRPGPGPGRAEAPRREWWAASGERRPERSVDPRSAGVGRPHLHVPQRGEKKALLEMVAKNAAEELVRHRLRRSADHNARARALNALQDALDLPEAPLRIECYDMSHLQGTDYVGSMVVMEDGLPKPSEYKRFKVRDVAGNDDYGAMEEVLTRRLTAYLTEKELPVAERKRHFSYPPQLLLVDGGKGQLNVAVRVLQELNLEEEIPVAALAKQFEEVYRPGLADPVRVPRGSEALYLLQRVRDEAHRFAITYHRQLRAKRMTVSVLDGVPGLGPVRKKRLLAELGSIKAVRQAPRETFEALGWLPDPVVEALWEKIHGDRGAGSALREARRAMAEAGAERVPVTSGPV